jgi:hypothetical protein
MLIFDPTTTFTQNTRTARMWIAQDDCTNVWVAEVYVRRPASVLYFVRRYRGARPRWRTLYRDACRYGRPSPRPYKLAQPCDGSITTCVVALFLDFCKARQVDPVTLLKQAYPDDAPYTKRGITSIRRQADWERTAYPARWNKRAVEGLLESLHEVNYEELIHVITDGVAEKPA